MSKLSREFKVRIKKKVEEIEAVSAVEIVPVYSKAASSYSAYHYTLPLFFAFFTALILPVLSWSYSKPWQVALLSVAVGALSFAIFSFPSLLIFFIPQSYIKIKVEAKAREQFLLQEVFFTRDRSGLLILICEREKAVFLLADRGLESKIDISVWVGLSDKLAKDFGRGNAGETFLTALDTLKESLAQKFPLRAGDQNELPNDVREDL